VTFAEFLRASQERGDLTAIDSLYLNRTHREAHGQVMVGRDAIRLALAAEAAWGSIPQVAIEADLGDVVATAITVSGDPSAGSRRRHHWLTWEARRIARELIVGDSPQLEIRQERSVGLFRPLGERRAGAGQFAVGEHAIVPDSASASDAPILDALHRIWNGRDLATTETLYTPNAQWRGPAGRSGGPSEARAWVNSVLTDLPDSWLLFERVARSGDRLAVLWRLIADEGERRLHLLGSSIFTIAGDMVSTEDTLVDEAALGLQRSLPIIDL
jgi:hypothetical protein